MKKFDPEVVDLAERIGQFYLDKNNGSYAGAEREIRELGVTKLEVTEEEYIIYTSRPERLIGKRGMNIDALQTHLGRHVKIVEADSIVDLMVPYLEEEDSSMPEDPFEEADQFCEWAYASSVQKRALVDKLTSRQKLLFGCACCRLIGHNIPEKLTYVIPMIEEFADTGKFNGETFVYLNDMLDHAGYGERVIVPDLVLTLWYLMNAALCANSLVVDKAAQEEVSRYIMSALIQIVNAWDDNGGEAGHMQEMQEGILDLITAAVYIPYITPAIQSLAAEVYNGITDAIGPLKDALEEAGNPTHTTHHLLDKGTFKGHTVLEKILVYGG